MSPAVERVSMAWKSWESSIAITITVIQCSTVHSSQNRSQIVNFNVNCYRTWSVHPASSVVTWPFLHMQTNCENGICEGQTGLSTQATNKIFLAIVETTRKSTGSPEHKYQSPIYTIKRTKGWKTYKFTVSEILRDSTLSLHMESTGSTIYRL